jgi:hypothetical protein
MKKRMKALEDQIEKLTGTNVALTDTVRALQKEKNDSSGNTDIDRGSSDDGNNSSASDNSPMLFKARKVRLLCYLHAGSHLANQDDRSRL